MSSALFPAAPVSDGAPSPLAVQFSVQAVAYPGIMPRIIELFAKRGLVPQRWQSTASETALTIEVQMTGLDRELAEYIARCMRQIHGVETVFTVETRHAA